MELRFAKKKNTPPKDDIMAGSNVGILFKASFNIYNKRFAFGS